LLARKEGVPVSRIALVLPVAFLLIVALPAQQNPTAPKNPYAGISPEDAAKTNPTKSSPESLAKGKKWWGIDCAMCHGQSGNGKGDVAQDMKLQISDFTDPATLKNRSDGELYWVIKNGHQDMPPEGPRLKGDELWDLVNYVRSLSKAKSETEQKP
jgi:mono/diheme cytochrome c family protein